MAKVSVRFTILGVKVKVSLKVMVLFRVRFGVTIRVELACFWL